MGDLALACMTADCHQNTLPVKHIKSTELLLTHKHPATISHLGHCKLCCLTTAMQKLAMERPPNLHATS